MLAVTVNTGNLHDSRTDDIDDIMNSVFGAEENNEYEESDDENREEYIDNLEL